MTFSLASAKYSLTFSTHDRDGNIIPCNNMVQEAMMGPFTELMQASFPPFYSYVCVFCSLI